jgi:hypothetical protein
MASIFKNLIDFKKINLKTRIITGFVMGLINTIIVYLADVVFDWSDLSFDYYGFYFIWMSIFGFFFAGIMIKKNF